MVTFLFNLHAIANKVYAENYQNKENNKFELVINKKTPTGNKDIYFVKRGRKLIVNNFKKSCDVL